MLNIIADHRPKALTPAATTLTAATLDLPLAHQLMIAAEWFLNPRQEAQAIALLEHAAEQWHLEQNETMRPEPVWQ